MLRQDIATIVLTLHPIMREYALRIHVIKSKREKTNHDNYSNSSQDSFQYMIGFMWLILAFATTDYFVCFRLALLEVIGLKALANPLKCRINLQF